ncbi:ribosomal protein L18 (plastid) [Cryptomonas paramecium]|uniref:Large ribosomal subunit protein uL18c n=1 Tax=Cryptomonas paramaecium TaxID=2898 RepID=D2ISA9_9CRYP|nr:ribosomal protein L18 [Cryptomonas paramecium]ACT46801.1 ribosomal protein L18 [Cryptomonas paramecium]BDA97994.1 ribosomal protein L18 [Cryptomonas paramecium]
MSKEIKKKSVGKYSYKGRYKLHGTWDKPRLSVFRSNNHIYAQLIDDTKKKTLVASSTLEKHLLPPGVSASTCKASILVGHSLAEKSLKENITKVVFDRGGKLYHGRVKALAEAAKEKGLQF